MIRKTILVLLTLGTFTTQAKALTPQHSDQLAQNLKQELELTKQQKLILKEIKTGAKQLQYNKKAFKSADKSQWIERYARGKMSERQVEKYIQGRFNSKLGIKLELAKDWSKFVGTLNEEQKATIIEVYKSTNRSIPKQTNPDPKTIDAKIAALLKGIQLSPLQKLQIKEIKMRHAQQERRAQRAKEATEGSWVKRLFTEQSSKREVLREIKLTTSGRADFRQDVAGEWMDLIDSFTKTQRNQFVKNINKYQRANQN